MNGHYGLMSYHIIRTMEDIERGAQVLADNCPLMREAFEVAGLPALRRHDNDFKSLARTITGQLLSVASASAIWGRVELLVRPFEPQTLLLLDETILRGAGLSNAKVRTLRALATAIIEGDVDFSLFESAEENLVRERLIKVHGIGPWTADIYVMFCLGRMDGFAPGDVALANAVALLQRAAKRPTPSQLEKTSRRWSPHRGVAARMLWHYYAVVKKRKTLPLENK